MPLELTKRDAKRLTLNRRMLQPPPPGAPPLDMRVFATQGIPGDVIFTLNALRELADQGNEIAKFMYEQARRRWGIDEPKVFLPTKR